MPMEILLKPKLVRETLKAKGYDLEEVEKGRAVVGQDLMILLQNMADKKPVDTNEMNEQEITIMSRTKVGSREENQLEGKDP